MGLVKLFFSNSKFKLLNRDRLATIKATKEHNLQLQRDSVEAKKSSQYVYLLLISILLDKFSFSKTTEKFLG